MYYISVLLTHLFLCFPGAPSIDPEVAAIRVQKHWKGFAQRRRAKRERDDEMMFIGMVRFVRVALSTC